MTPRANPQKRSEQDYSDRDFVRGSNAENFQFGNAHEIVEVIVSNGLATIRDMDRKDYGLVIKVPSSCSYGCTSESGYRASIAVDNVGLSGPWLADDWWTQRDNSTPPQYEQQSRASVHGHNWCLFIWDGSCIHNGKNVALDLFELLGGELRGYVPDFRSPQDIAAFIELNEAIGNDYSVDFDEETHEINICVWGNDPELGSRDLAWLARFGFTSDLGPRMGLLELTETFNAFGIEPELKTCMIGWGWYGILFQLDPDTDAPDLSQALPALLGALSVSLNPLAKPTAYDPPYHDVDSVIRALGEHSILGAPTQTRPEGWDGAWQDDSIRTFDPADSFDPYNELALWIECPKTRGSRLLRANSGTGSGETLIVDDGLLVTITSINGLGDERTKRLANAVQDVLGGEVLYAGDPDDGAEDFDEEFDSESLDNTPTGS